MKSGSTDWWASPANVVRRLRADWVLATSIALVLLGLWLRTRRMFVWPMPFWLDEAHWIRELLRAPLDKPSIRPVGFVALTKFMAHAFGASEVSLRFWPWLAGVLGCVLSVPLGRRLTRAPASRLLFVAIIALHPVAIDYAKEFKPYSISLLVHLFCLYGAVRYWERASLRWLLASTLVALFGVLLAQDVIFAYPSLYLALAIAAYRQRRGTHFVALGVILTLTLGLLLFLYVTYWQYMTQLTAGRRHMPAGLVSNWWSPEFDLFYVPNETESRFAWYARKYFDFVAFPGVRRDNWTASWFPDGLLVLRRIDSAVWALLHVIGLALLAWRRRFEQLLLFSLPLLVMIAFNLFQRWPFGVLRTNLFALAYLAPVAAAVFDTPPTGGRGLRQLVPALTLCVAPLALFESHWHEIKLTAGNTEYIEVMSTLVALKGESTERELLLLDNYMCDVWHYYAELHPGHRKLNEKVRARFKPVCARLWGESPYGYIDKHRYRGVFWVAAATAQGLAELSSPPKRFVVLEQRAIRGDVAAVARVRRRGR